MGVRFRLSSTSKPNSSSSISGISNGVWRADFGVASLPARYAFAPSRSGTPRPPRSRSPATSSSFFDSPNTFCNPCISTGVIKRHVPGRIPSTRKCMIRTRVNRFTLYPKYSHMRRICRFKPCCKIIRNFLLPSCFTTQGKVVVPKMGTPADINAQKSAANSLSTSTTYSLSCRFPARNILFTISPSSVSINKPSESLSKRPTGNIRL